MKLGLTPFISKDLGSFGDGSTCLSTIDYKMFCCIGTKWISRMAIWFIIMLPNQF